MRRRTGRLGDRNIVGEKILAYRIANNILQKDFLAHLQIRGLDISAVSLARIEGQMRFVRDHEVIIIASAMKTTPNELLGYCFEDYF